MNTPQLTQEDLEWLSDDVDRDTFSGAAGDDGWQQRTTDYAAAAADLLAEQRAAMLERTGITVVKHDDWYVLLDGKCLMFRFDDDDAAYTFAYELAGELIEQGDLTV